MQFIGLILFIFSCIGMVCGFIYGDSNFGLYSYEFSLPLAWAWWSTASILLALSGICFTFPNISEMLANIASSTKKIADLQERLEKPSIDYYKPGDAHDYPRGRNESNQDYWERVSKRQQLAGTPKAGDDPRYPRFRDESNQDYWDRITKASSNT